MRSECTLPLLLTNLDDIAWVLNLRGKEFDCNPIFTSYLLIEETSSTLYIGAGIVEEDIKSYLTSLNVNLQAYKNVQKDLV